MAAVHQFGSDRVPARPILTTSFERNAEDLALLSATVNDAVIEGGINDIEPALRSIGQFAQSELQRDFTRASQDFAPLADSTVARKGHSTPLLDSSHLRNEVRFKVET